MTFSTVMTVLCAAYILVYAGMIMYDLFLAKEAVDTTPRMDEEEIDISDELLSFKPTEIGKAMNGWNSAEKLASGSQGRVVMTNGIESEKLVPMMEEMAVLGADSPLGGMIQDWSEHDMAA